MNRPLLIHLQARLNPFIDDEADVNKSSDEEEDDEGGDGLSKSGLPSVLTRTQNSGLLI